jgi:hypothetical protein
MTLSFRDRHRACPIAGLISPLIACACRSANCVHFSIHKPAQICHRAPAPVRLLMPLPLLLLLLRNRKRSASSSFAACASAAACCRMYRMAYRKRAPGEIDHAELGLRFACVRTQFRPCSAFRKSFCKLSSESSEINCRVLLQRLDCERTNGGCLVA